MVTQPDVPDPSPVPPEESTPSMSELMAEYPEDLEATPDLLVEPGH